MSADTYWSPSAAAQGGASDSSRRIAPFGMM